MSKCFKFSASKFYWRYKCYTWPIANQAVITMQTNYGKVNFANAMDH